MVSANEYIAASKKAVSKSRPNLVKSTFVKMNKSNTK